MKKIFKFLIITFILSVFLIIYMRYIGTKDFITKEYTIKTINIPDSFNGLKIVHFTDLHYNRIITIKKIKSIVDEINLINPDIVVFTGDLIDQDVTLNDRDYEKLADVLAKINAKYGKYAITGNHDYMQDIDKIIKVYNDSDFTYLDNAYDIIYSPQNEKIFIGGINSIISKKADLDKTMSYFKDDNDNTYKIILIHEPDFTDTIKEKYNVNLILAGHSHNGQIRLPVIGALYTPEYAKKYYDNYYNVNGTDLYISSGIGVSKINYRLFNKPSINFYRINKDTSN